MVAWSEAALRLDGLLQPRALRLHGVFVKRCMTIFVLPETDERTVLKVDTEGNELAALEDEKFQQRNEILSEGSAPGC